jgi:predicted nucleic acid-binding protein
VPNEAHLVDTNILLRLTNPLDAMYGTVRLAVKILSNRKAPMFFSMQNMTEFWNVSTREANHNGYGLTAQQTMRRIRTIEASMSLLPDSAETYLIWQKLVEEHSVLGVQVHDARLVASMKAHNIERILTLNGKDFRRYPSITVIHPADLY